ncbi:uncharacterized protein mRpL50 [Chelonus insularis]|uniref:uncharacterized protein mRpL50 n=1 Tax=Chelonus insularis TaxID=460826 RepID=UPI00158CDDF8|nr:uncharacterized protein LOC118069479 [Chelonus insularis]
MADCTEHNKQEQTGGQPTISAPAIQCNVQIILLILLRCYLLYVCTLHTLTQSLFNHGVFKMAALIKHGNVGSSIFAKTTLLAFLTAPVRHYPAAKPQRGRSNNKRLQPKVKVYFKSKWEWDEKSLLTKGFLRNVKTYEPPSDVSEKLEKICKDNGISANSSTTIDDLQKRFEFFNICAKEFNYAIPNSILYEIQTISDVEKFYKTPINTNSPMNEITKIELPQNLHILENYHRFHPDTDTKFGGKTAFPKSSTIVTSIKYKKKYPGFYLGNPYE